MSRIRDRERYYNNESRREYIYKTSSERRKRKWYWNIHNKTAKMIRKLWIRPETCPICWYEWRIIAHHPDYNKPNEIVFCCQICHDNIHKEKISVEWDMIIDLSQF